MQFDKGMSVHVALMLCYFVGFQLSHKESWRYKNPLISRNLIPFGSRKTQWWSKLCITVFYIVYNSICLYDSMNFCWNSDFSLKTHFIFLHIVSFEVYTLFIPTIFLSLRRYVEVIKIGISLESNHFPPNHFLRFGNQK